jgi:hypothetical protein
MSTPEELEAQRLAAEQQMKEAAQAAAKKPLILEGDDIPEAFRGKSAKELVDRVLATSVETERLKVQNAEREAELQRIKNPPQQQLSDEDKEALRERDFLSRPTKFMDQQFEERLAPLRKTYFEGQALTVKEMMRGKLKEFAKHEKKVDEYLSQLPLEARANPQAIEGAYKLARLDDLDAREAELSAKYGLHTETGGTPPQSSHSKPQIDDEERKVMKEWGMSEEDWVKYGRNSTFDEFEKK